MARFVGSTSNQAPLQMQLQGTTVPAVVTGFMAIGESQLGSATRPFLTRPSAAGTGSGTEIPFSESGAASGCELAVSFSIAPSLPPSGAFLGYYGNLPIKVRWANSKRNGFVVPLFGAVVLYADATGGHLWTGELIWEEA